MRVRPSKILSVESLCYGIQYQKNLATSMNLGINGLKALTIITKFVLGVITK
ncbi:MAG: hypothetical protein IIC67_09690 [Thaumarchaeota archaeon]|nr:hypothetical protein [Nitrososphaerota archaeon]